MDGYRTEPTTNGSDVPTGSVGGSPPRGLRTVAASGIAAALLTLGPTAGAADDKSAYSLADPTPDRLLRDLTTDRPDITETPFTVDAGRVQIESTLAAYSRSRPDSTGAVSDTHALAVTNVRIGLTRSAELGVVVEPYGAIRTKEPSGVSSRVSGVGAVLVRGKFNIWGNDTFGKFGSTALGVLPYISLPTDRSNGISPGAVEGGLVVPFAVGLSHGFGFGLNAGVHAVKNADTPGHHAEYSGSASLSYAWTENFGTYYEVAMLTGTGNPLGKIVVVGAGVTYKVRKNLQLDAGVNFGVTKASDRVNPFIGLSARF